MEKTNTSGQLKLMHCDTLNGGQGLLPYADPDCKSQSGRHFLTEKGGRAAAGGTQARHPQLPASPDSTPPPEVQRSRGPVLNLAALSRLVFSSPSWKHLNELSS